METYILLVFMKYYDSASAISQEFNSRATCEYARAQVEKSPNVKEYTNNYSICVKK